MIQIGEKVLILDKGKLGKEASWAAAGMLAGRMESEPGEEKLFPLLVKGQLAWPKFAQELERVSGTNIEYKKDGKKRLKEVVSVEIPQDAVIAILHVG